MAIKRQQEDGMILYLECVKANILIVMMFYSFARCCRWEKLERLQSISQYYFLQLHVNL